MIRTRKKELMFSETIFSVTQTLDINLGIIKDITGTCSSALLDGGTAVICFNNKLKSYSLQTGDELSSTDIRGADKLTEVKIGGKLALAVSSRLVCFKCKGTQYFHQGTDSSWKL